MQTPWITQSLRTPRLLLAAALVILLPLALTACDTEPEMGDETIPVTEPAQEAMPPDAASEDAMPVSPEVEGPMAAGEVEVSLVDYEINMPSTLPAGPTTFRVRNDGNSEHSFEVEGQGVEEALETPLQPGGTATLEVDLSPGSYEIYCPVADHADRGMRMTLEVTESEGMGGAA